jgi:hypothetical protein
VAVWWQKEPNCPYSVSAFTVSYETFLWNHKINSEMFCWLQLHILNHLLKVLRKLHGYKYFLNNPVEQVVTPWVVATLSLRKRKAMIQPGASCIPSVFSRNPNHTA